MVKDIDGWMDGRIDGPMFVGNLLYLLIPKNIIGVHGDWVVVKAHHLHCPSFDVYDSSVEFWAQVDHPIVLGYVAICYDLNVMMYSGCSRTIPCTNSLHA